MADYITLLGAEDVQRAGRAMAQAAEQMMSAASTMHSAVEQQQRFLDEWLNRFSYEVDRLERLTAITPEKGG